MGAVKNTRSSGEMVFERRSKHMVHPSVSCSTSVVGGDHHHETEQFALQSWEAVEMTITRTRAKTRSHLDERFGGRGLHDAFDLLQIALHRLDSAKHGADHFEKLGNVGLRMGGWWGWFRSAGGADGWVTEWMNGSDAWMVSQMDGSDGWFGWFGWFRVLVRQGEKAKWSRLHSIIRLGSKFKIPHIRAVLRRNNTPECCWTASCAPAVRPAGSDRSC